MKPRYTIYCTPPNKAKPKVLKLPSRPIKSSGDPVGETTPHFRNQDPSSKGWNSVSPVEQEIGRPPKYLPPLQPLLHSPRAHGMFVFKSIEKNRDQFLATFRGVQSERKERAKSNQILF